MSRLLKRLLAATAVIGALSVPALVGSLSGPALAQSGDDRLGKALQGLVDVLDLNKDGTIDRAELDAAKGGGAARDGSATAAAPETPAQPKDESARDGEGDGSVSRQEFLAKAERRFARMDVNGDGRLDEAEREARHRKWGRGWRHDREERSGWREERRGPRAEKGGEDRDGRSRRADRMFERFDANDDGTITRAEVEAARERWHDWRGKDRG